MSYFMYLVNVIFYNYKIKYLYSLVSVSINNIILDATLSFFFKEFSIFEVAVELFCLLLN